MALTRITTNQIDFSNGVRSNPDTTSVAEATLKVGLCGPNNPSWLGNPAAGDFVAFYVLATSEESRPLVWGINPVVNVETGQPAAAWGIEVDINIGTADTVDPHTGQHAIGIECVSGAQFAPSAAFSSYSTTLANRWKHGIWLDSIGGQTGSALIKSYVNCSPEYGIDFSNSLITKQAVRIGATPAYITAGVAVKQRTAGETGIFLQRSTDVSASGNIIEYVNAANNTVITSLDVFGQFSTAGYVNAKSFFSGKGTTAVSAGIQTALFPLDEEGTYLVTVYVQGAGTNNSSVTMAINDGTTLFLAPIKSGANTVLGVSGTSITDTQAGTTTVTWTYVKIA